MGLVSNETKGSASPLPAADRPSVPRRREGGRSARVVGAVLEATLEEVASRGYGALSIEAVAARAGVAKTTIYRRWPTRAELTRQALSAELAARPPVADTGNLLDDLTASTLENVKRLATPRGLALVRVVYAEGGDPELAELIRAFRVEARRGAQTRIGAAIERGEVPREIDVAYLLDTLAAVVHHRVVLIGAVPSRAEVRRLVARSLAGACLATDRGGAPA